MASTTFQISAEEGDQHDDEGQERNAERDVGQPHQHRVDPAAEIAGKQPDERADRPTTSSAAGEADQPSAGRAPKTSCEKMSRAQVGGAERELRRGRLAGEPRAAVLDDLVRMCMARSGANRATSNEERRRSPRR